MMTKTVGQSISKANCQAVNSSKNQMNQFVFTTMRHVFVPFLEEIEDTKKTFRNYLTFDSIKFRMIFLAERPPWPNRMVWSFFRVNII